MEFQSPPTSLTDEEADMRDSFTKRVDFTHDLNDASDFLKWHWMHTPVSPVPLEIKTHVLEDDPIAARHEFEARSAFLEDQHSPEEGRTFKAYGHRHEQTTQHFAELAFRNGTVKYVVVWIEKDAEVTGPEPELTRHFSVYGAEYNRTYVRCDCGWAYTVPTDIAALGRLETAFGEHMRDSMIDAEVITDA